MVLVREIWFKSWAVSRTADIFLGSSGCWQCSQAGVLSIASDPLLADVGKTPLAIPVCTSKKVIPSGQNGYKHRSRRKKRSWNRISAQGLQFQAELEILGLVSESAVSFFFIFIFKFHFNYDSFHCLEQKVGSNVCAGRASLKSVYGIWDHKSWRNSWGFLQLKSCLLSLSSSLSAWPPRKKNCERFSTCRSM